MIILKKMKAVVICGMALFLGTNCQPPKAANNPSGQPKDLRKIIKNMDGTFFASEAAPNCTLKITGNSKSLVILTKVTAINLKTPCTDAPQLPMSLAFNCDPEIEVCRSGLDSGAIRYEIDFETKKGFNLTQVKVGDKGDIRGFTFLWEPK